MAGTLQIPADVAAEMTPAVRAFVDALLKRIDDLEVELKSLNKTPQNSSLPPSTQHPHAKPRRTRTEVEEEARRSAGPPEARAALDSDRGVRRGRHAQAAAVPALRERRCAATTPSRCGIRSGNCPRSSRW